MITTPLGAALPARREWRPSKQPRCPSGVASARYARSVSFVSTSVAVSTSHDATSSTRGLKATTSAKVMRVVACQWSRRPLPCYFPRNNQCVLCPPSSTPCCHPLVPWTAWAALVAHAGHSDRLAQVAPVGCSAETAMSRPFGDPIWELPRGVLLERVFGEEVAPFPFAGKRLSHSCKDTPFHPKRREVHAGLHGDGSCLASEDVP